MKFNELETHFSSVRLQRYLLACNGDKAKAALLYQLNIELSLALFAQIGSFEVMLRNAINREMQKQLGSQWLKDSIDTGGCFCGPQFRHTSVNIMDALLKLGGSATNDQLVSALGFGFWRYLFAPQQYAATRNCLLNVFPARPASAPQQHYNARYFFNQLAVINRLRNRIAHHEPVCFAPGKPQVCTAGVNANMQLLTRLSQWMNVPPHILQHYSSQSAGHTCAQMLSLAA
jgi:hypothetical protein